MKQSGRHQASTVPILHHNPAVNTLHIGHAAQGHRGVEFLGDDLQACAHARRPIAPKP
jgi:hypothetical protein